MGKIEIISGGVQTSVQDAGRVSFQKMGMPMSGVMDNYAARCANMLVGNRDNAALLECALLGPEIRFLEKNLVAVAGADMNAAINGVKVKAWKSYLVNAGDVLKLHHAASGMRAYIAFAGGIDVPLLMGSYSTYIRGGIGGFLGRVLKTGDVLDTFCADKHLINEMDDVHIPKYPSNLSIRVVLGPHHEHFSKAGLDTFLTQEYTIGSRSDRMGIFLEGSPIAFSSKTADILSSAILMGSIQVTNDAAPIILMAERQTTGGYAQIATVISADLPKLAQARPNDRVRFQKVDVYEAQDLYKEYEQVMAAIKEELSHGVSALSSRTKDLTLNGKTYRAIIEEVM